MPGRYLSFLGMWTDSAFGCKQGRNPPVMSLRHVNHNAAMHARTTIIDAAAQRLGRGHLEA